MEETPLWTWERTKMLPKKQNNRDNWRNTWKRSSCWELLHEWKIHLVLGTTLQINNNSCLDGHSAILIAVHFPVLFSLTFFGISEGQHPTLQKLFHWAGPAAPCMTAKWENDLSSFSSWKIHLRLYDLDGLSHQVGVIWHR